MRIFKWYAVGTNLAVGAINIWANLVHEPTWWRAISAINIGFAIWMLWDMRREDARRIMEALR